MRIVAARGIERSAVSLHQYVERIRSDAVFSDQEKRDILDAIDYLKQVIGKGFLKQVFQGNHPLRSRICNLAPWSQQWLVWLVGLLRYLESRPQNLDKFTTRLKRKKEFFEACSFALEIEYLKKRGIEFKLEPLQLNSPKIPDIQFQIFTDRLLFGYSYEQCVALVVEFLDRNPAIHGIKLVEERPVNPNTLSIFGDNFDFFQEEVFPGHYTLNLFVWNKNVSAPGKSYRGIFSPFEP